MKKSKLVTCILIVISVICISCISVYAEEVTSSEIIPPVESKESSESIEETFPLEPNIEETPNVDPDIEVKPNTPESQPPLEESLEPPAQSDNQDILSEITKIRIALEIMVYGAFPVCVAVFLLVKFILCFKHYFI